MTPLGETSGNGLAGLQRFFRANLDNPALHVVRGQPLGDDMLPLPDARPSTRSARVVEGEALRVLPVLPFRSSCFTHFLDGIQCSRQVCFWEGIPVILGYAAACVRQRSPEGHMGCADGLVRQETALIFPFDLIAPQTFAAAGLRCIPAEYAKDVRDEDRSHPAIVREQEFRTLDRLREGLELELTRAWCGSAGPDHWLLVDGSLTRFARGGGHDRVVGVIKSHQTRYFAGEQQRLILTLPPEHRTSVFQPHTKGYQPVYSWYLRLRDPSAQDLSFGLIRVEASESQSSLAAAGDISSWLLAERSPLSLPDPRWDRMIYPIRDCEQYLKSIAPSRAWMSSLTLL